MMAQGAAWQPDSNRPHPVVDAAELRTYRAELPADVLDPQGELLDWVIGYSFDTLDAAQLTLRVTAPFRTSDQSADVL
jgi:hypothetical protein